MLQSSHKEEYTDIKETYQIQIYAQTDWQTIHEVNEFDYINLTKKFDEACKKYPKPIRMVKHHYCPHRRDWEETLWHKEEQNV